MITSWRKDHGATGVTGDRGMEREGGTETGKDADMAIMAPEMTPAGAFTTRAKIKTSNLNLSPN